MTWLTSLPTWVLVVAWLAAAFAIAAGSRRLVGALVPAAQRADVRGIVAPLMPALGAVFAVLTAITLSSEVGYLKSAQDIVAGEAAAAARLAWTATSPQVPSDEVHDALLTYLRSTRADEWNGDRAATGDDAGTGEALATLERVVRVQAARTELGTPLSTELLASLDAVTAGRRARIAAADRSLPALYVVTLVASGIALIANAGALVVGVGRRAAALVIGLAAVVGLSLALLFALSAPWRGPLVVSGDAIDRVIRDIRDGYFAP